MLPFLIPKEMLEILRLNPNMKKNSPADKKLAEMCQKYAFYVLLFVLPERFGDSYGRVRDSACIQETPG